MRERPRPMQYARAGPRDLESAVAFAIAHARGIAEAGEKVLEAVGGAFGLIGGVLWRLDEARQHLGAVATWASDPAVSTLLEETPAGRLGLHEGMIGSVWSKRQVIWSGDLWTDDRRPSPAAARLAGLQSTVAFPLVSRGEVVGVAELFSSTAIAADPEVSGILEGLGVLIGSLLERVHADEAIAQSEARKAAILDAALDVIVTAGADGRILEVNRAITPLLGWDPDEVVGAPVAEMLVPPEFRDRHEAGFRRYADTGEARVVGQRLEVTALHRDGSRVPIELTITSVAGPGPRLFTAYLRDIRERRQIEAERTRLLEAETAARTSAEAAWLRLRLVSDVSELLAVTFRYPEAFERLADRVVSDIADICLIDTIDERDVITRVAAKHHDRRMQPLADRLLSEFAPDPHGLHPVASVVKTTQPRFSPFMSDDFLHATCRNEEHYQLVRQLGFQSYICVPLIARSRILGAVTLISTDPARRYTERDLAVAEEIARRAAIRIDNARLYQERDRVAHVLQQGLLARRLPEVPGLEVATRYFPAGDGIEAGGDFYDVFRAGRDRWGLVIGDVCGKGPEAAAGMGLARPALRALAHAYRSPSRLLHALNAELLAQGVDGRFLTIAYVQARVSSDTGADLTTCLAGHPPGILVTGAGKVRELGTQGTLLGLFTDLTLREQRMRMTRGDTLILYTDGLADEPGSPAPLTRAQLERILTQHRGASAEAVAARIEQAVNAAPRRPPGARDDIAYLVVRCMR